MLVDNVESSLTICRLLKRQILRKVLLFWFSSPPSVVRISIWILSNAIPMLFLHGLISKVLLISRWRSYSPSRSGWRCFHRRGKQRSYRRIPGHRSPCQQPWRQKERWRSCQPWRRRRSNKMVWRGMVSLDSRGCWCSGDLLGWQTGQMWYRKVTARSVVGIISWYHPCYTKNASAGNQYEGSWYVWLNLQLRLITQLKSFLVITPVCRNRFRSNLVAHTHLDWCSLDAGGRGCECGDANL